MQQARPSRRFYDRTVQVDPFPAYAHDVTLVEQMLLKVTHAFPFAEPVAVSIMPYEGTDHVNGHCEIIYDYKGKQKDLYPWGASIVLWGKRIPPHPAMTRYLVAHEYGHAVDMAIARSLGFKDTDKLRKQYTQLRPVAPRGRLTYGGLTWHRSVGEIFANDFRILVCGVEPEFWPHPGTPRPEGNRKLLEWWQDQTAKAIERMKH